VLTARGEWRALREAPAGEWASPLLAGVFLAGHFVAWIASLALTSVAASVALVSTQPVWVAVFGLVALGEHPSRRQWLGVAPRGGRARRGSGGGISAGGQDPSAATCSRCSARSGGGVLRDRRRLRQRIGLWPYVAVVYGCATLVLLLAALLAAVPLVAGVRRHRGLDSCSSRSPWAR
jgi:hypothetical protein